MAGSLECFLCPSAPVFSSREEVPAGVSGGECMADAGDEAMEERCPECTEVVLEAGLGEGALHVLAVLGGRGLIDHAKELAYS